VGDGEYSPLEHVCASATSCTSHARASKDRSTPKDAWITVDVVPSRTAREVDACGDVRVRVGVTNRNVKRREAIAKGASIDDA